jgi:hypothetical protein
MQSFYYLHICQRNTQPSAINGCGPYLQFCCKFIPLTFHREAQGFILAYSVASWSTFDRLEVFRQSVRQTKRGDAVMMVVGNQCDKVNDREVAKEEGAALA